MLLTDIINPAMFDHIEPSDLVTTGSLSCFKNFVYVGEDPKAWPFSDDYCEGLKVVIALTDTNDHAERGVALIEEYSSILIVKSRHNILFKWFLNIERNFRIAKNPPQLCNLRKMLC